MTNTETMTAARFITFLERLVRSTVGKGFLIVDCLRARGTDAVESWVAAHRGAVGVVLPAALRARVESR